VLFEENVKTEGFLVIDIKPFLEYDQVFYGNVSETRFYNEQAYSAFSSYQVTPQEYLRTHWASPETRHGSKYGVSFVSIGSDPILSSGYGLSGSYKTFTERGINEIIYFILTLTG